MLIDLRMLNHPCEPGMNPTWSRVLFFLHRPLFSCFVQISSIDITSELTATSTLLVKDDNYFVFDGVMYEPGLVEHIAQSAAAYAGYESYINNEEPHLGYIGEIKKCTFFGLPSINDEITTNLEVVSKFENISLIKAQSFIDGKLIVECQMKIFIKM